MTLSLGLLSTAHSHANSYVSVAEGIPDAEFVAVADADDERGRRFADRHGLTFEAAEAVLDRADAAVVCAANADHVEWVERAAGAGVDVLCEKPLATTGDRADDAVEACAAAGVSLGVAMPVRFTEPVRRAKRAVDTGEVGEPKAFVGTNLLQQKASGWFTDPDLSGGGAVMDHSVHVVDLIRWLSGQEVAEVYAEPGIQFSDTPVEDVDVLSMSLEDGTPATHDGSWRQPEEWDYWGDVTLRVVGTEGVVEVDCFDQTLRHTRDTGDDPGIDSVYWGSNMDEGLIREFVASVREGRDPAVTGREAAREVRVVDAAYRSLETGRPEPVEYPDESA